jgi:hypothetical protein
VHDRSWLIPRSGPERASSAWQAWWTTLVASQSEACGTWTDVGPPVFGSLDAFPILQPAARELHDEACAWLYAHRGPWIRSLRRGLAWQIKTALVIVLCASIDLHASAPARLARRHSAASTTNLEDVL